MTRRTRARTRQAGGQAERSCGARWHARSWTSGAPHGARGVERAWIVTRRKMDACDGAENTVRGTRTACERPRDERCAAAADVSRGERERARETEDGWADQSHGLRASVHHHMCVGRKVERLCRRVGRNHLDAQPLGWDSYSSCHVVIAARGVLRGAVGRICSAARYRMRRSSA